MSHTRLSRAAAALALGAVALAGCTSTSTDSPTQSGADAVSALRAAVAKTNQTTSTFTSNSTLDGGAGSSTGTGTSDPAAKASTFHTELTTQQGNIKIDAILVGTDLYLKIPGTTPGDSWGHVDTTKVKSLAKLGLDANGSATNLDVFDKTLSDARLVSPGAYSGTMDGTKNPALTASNASEALKAMTFEANLDAEGRLVSLTTHTPPLGSSPATTSTVRLADFGKPVTITKPAAAEVQEMPDTFYTALQ